MIHACISTSTLIGHIVKQNSVFEWKRKPVIPQKNNEKVIPKNKNAKQKV